MSTRSLGRRSVRGATLFLVLGSGEALDLTPGRRGVELLPVLAVEFVLLDDELGWVINAVKGDPDSVRIAAGLIETADPTGRAEEVLSCS